MKLFYALESRVTFPHKNLQVITPQITLFLYKISLAAPVSAYPA